MTKVIDKAGEQYWSAVWNEAGLPESINPDDHSLGNIINIRYHELFSKLLQSYDTKGKLMLEVGCGNSVWLPYFNKRFGMQTDGLDYSEVGCEQSRKIFRRDGIQGNIYLGDMFNPPVELIGNYDFVISMGVVEHFSDTSEVIKSLKKFLKPGGVLITSLPNHNGLLGFIVKTFNRPLFDIHYLIDVKHIRKGYDENGLELSFLDYVLCPSFFLNLDQHNGKLRFFFLRKLAAKFLAMFSLILIFTDKNLFRVPTARFISPAILAIGKVKS